jgi:Ca2+-binding EF-hand superfamily protein
MLYDRNDDKVIKKDELKIILKKMVVFSHIYENSNDDINKLVKCVLSSLDSNKDGEIDKNEFITGLQNNTGLYAIYMNPFPLD